MGAKGAYSTKPQRESIVRRSLERAIRKREEGEKKGGRAGALPPGERENLRPYQPKLRANIGTRMFIW